MKRIMVGIGAGAMLFATGCGGVSDEDRNGAHHRCEMLELGAKARNAKSPAEAAKIAKRQTELAKFLKIQREHGATEEGMAKAMQEKCPDLLKK